MKNIALFEKPENEQIKNKIDDFLVYASYRSDPLEFLEYDTFSKDLELTIQRKKYILLYSREEIKEKIYSQLTEIEIEDLRQFFSKFLDKPLAWFIRKRASDALFLLRSSANKKSW